jgi:hypothetical protein
MSHSVSPRVQRIDGQHSCLSPLSLLSSPLLSSLRSCPCSSPLGRDCPDALPPRLPPSARLNTPLRLPPPNKRCRPLFTLIRSLVTLQTEHFALRSLTLHSYDSMTSPRAAPLFLLHSPCHHRSPCPALLSHTSARRCARQLDASRHTATCHTASHST